MTARVLVVDDLLPNIKLLEAKLSMEYYDVFTAKSGTEALEVARNNPVDIILLDVMMPGMDGFECCRQLKADPKLCHIPVVMVTALSDVEDRVNGLQAGADDFLTKPINDMALFARIRSLVRLKIMMEELQVRMEGKTDLDDMPSGVSSNEEIKEAHIVIVDDDVVQGKFIAERLEAMSSNVEIISEVKGVEEKVIESNCDLAIISTQLSDIDGLRLCSHIRNHEKGRSIPLLMLVEEDDTNILVKGLDMGVNDYLVTPVDGNEVKARATTQIKRKRFQDALRNHYQKSLSMAVTDGLTGVYNRGYFDKHAPKLLDAQKETEQLSLSVFMIDIDHFKQINDTHGHQAGDEILRGVTQRIVSNVRITDLVARYGGEEFVVVLPRVDSSGAKSIAERVRASVDKNPFEISSKDAAIAVTVSIGGACMIEGDSIDNLISRADKALYAAKENGRNQLIYNEFGQES